MRITPELAEMAGVHAGDGYLRYVGRRKELDISGNLDEKEYYDNYLIPLFNNYFGLNIKGKTFLTRNTYGFVIRDEKVLQVFQELGFPSGKKSTIVKCPAIIQDSKDSTILRHFIRGYFDTDGSLTFDKKIYLRDTFKKTKNFYPRLMFTCVSQNLTEDFLNIVHKLGFKATCSVHCPNKTTENIRYKTQLVGLKNLNKWIKEVGTKNPTKYSRYLIWKRFGFCPPSTTYKQRINILKGNLSPYSF
jgi:hypothetical protein